VIYTKEVDKSNEQPRVSMTRKSALLHLKSPSQFSLAKKSKSFSFAKSLSVLFSKKEVYFKGVGQAGGIGILVKKASEWVVKMIYIYINNNKN
jgi:hypothetical protein